MLHCLDDGDARWHAVDDDPSNVWLQRLEVDVATGAAGRPRHLARHVRTRAELFPDDLPLWCPGDWI